MGRFLVHGIEINPLQRSSKNTDDILYVLKLPMGNCDAVTDSGAPELFPFKDYIHDLFLVLYEVCLFQGTNQLYENVLLG